MIVYRIDKLYTGRNIKLLDVLDDEIVEKGNTVLREELVLPLDQIEKEYKGYYGWWVSKSIEELYEEYGHYKDITTYLVEDFITLADLNEKGMLIATKKRKSNYELA